jgi:hypothetical protein
VCRILDYPCKLCNKLLPLHLGDYETDPEEVEVFCQDHLPDKEVRIFTLTDTDKHTVRARYPNEDKAYPVGWKMGIRYLTDNAKENAYMNHPNLGVDWEYEDL